MKKILIIDDDQNILDLLVQVFTENGYLVTAYSDSVKASRLENLEYDIVISDIMMPIIDGVTLIQGFIDQGFSGSIYFITGYSEYPREILNNFKPKAIIFKPFDLEEIVQLVKMRN
jgi:DNA-binding NtrC family response regulator